MKGVIVFVVVLGMASIGWGQSYYQYVDKNGTICFTEDPNNVNVRGAIEKDGIKVLKNKVRETNGSPVQNYQTKITGEARWADEQRLRRKRDQEQAILDYQKAVEGAVLAEQRRIQLEQERQAREAAEAQRQTEEYRKKTYGITDPYLSSRVGHPHPRD